MKLYTRTAEKRGPSQCYFPPLFESQAKFAKVAKCVKFEKIERMRKLRIPCALLILFLALRSNNTTTNTMSDPKKAAVELSATGGETFVNVCLNSLAFEESIYCISEFTMLLSSLICHFLM